MKSLFFSANMLILDYDRSSYSQNLCCSITLCAMQVAFSSDFVSEFAALICMNLFVNWMLKQRRQQVQINNVNSFLVNPPTVVIKAPLAREHQ